MVTATEYYKGKREEQQLVLMTAQLRLRQGNADGALAILQSIKPGFTSF